MADLTQSLEVSIRIKDLDAFHGLMNALTQWLEDMDRKASLTDREMALVLAVQAFADGDGLSD